MKAHAECFSIDPDQASLALGRAVLAFANVFLWRGLPVQTGAKSILM